MEIRSIILQYLLLFMFTFIFFVESGNSQLFSSNRAQFSGEYSQFDGEYTEKNPSAVMNGAEPVATCALLMCGNAIIASINFCSNKTDTNCPYLENGGSFTAWIHITPEQTLQVWITGGSYPQAHRPANPLIEYPNFRVPPGSGENASLFFRRSSSCQKEIKGSVLNNDEIPTSWSSDILSATEETGHIPISRRDGIAWYENAVGGSAVGGMVATFVIIGFLSMCLAMHHPTKSIKDCLGRSAFSYTELYVATRGFRKSSLLGNGGLGTVYKGFLERYGNTPVAVKRINYDSKYAHKSFSAEISCLSEIQHDSVVELLGWSHERGRLLLVYEFMSNGSLYEWLHENSHDKQPLPWKLRQNILEGIATAIEYLHTKCPLCLLHRNIKSSNIMLDFNFTAHLGDFGLAFLLDHQKQYHRTITEGYLEYMAPELPYTGKATKESDVYSFGILVLEVICGKHPLDMKAVEADDLVLLYNCWQAHLAGTLLNMVDPRLFEISQSAKMKRVIHEPMSFNVTENAPSAFHDISESIDIFNTVFEDGVVKENMPPNFYDINDPNNIDVNHFFEDDTEVNTLIMKNLLHLGLLCCLPNPQARPTIEMVVEVLKQIGHTDNVEYIITNVSTPSLPDTRPLGPYCSMEISQHEFPTK